MNEHPMPGPPECLPTGFPHEGAVINAPGCLLHARSYHANSKRLKNDECEKELEASSKHAPTWKRFAARPHALEDTND